jgi:hypothetical protein
MKGYGACYKKNLLLNPTFSTAYRHLPRHSMPNCPQNRPCPVRDPQFVENVVEMAFYRVTADRKEIADFRVRQSFGGKI